MIVLTDKKREPFQIDEEDYACVSRYPWWIDSQGYPSTSIGKGRIGKECCRLHAFLGGRALNGLQWDHINRDRLDNRRINLRLVPKAINGQNAGLRRDNKSGVRGVYWDVGEGKWMVQIRAFNRVYTIGRFKALEEAKAAREAAEKVYHSEAY